MNEEKRWLELQNNLETGIVSEEDLSDEEIEALKQLYEEQISLLQKMQEVYKKKINCHRINIRNNMDELKRLNKKK